MAVGAGRGTNNEHQVPDIPVHPELWRCVRVWHGRMVIMH